ncbi:uncharacterized protein LOC133206379 [Saccostrea echinata]|uniref:uncharacterized protein LOC133206379 n=1 Tax=Saccostrea echinata TaxID=191078 RepID=UPI002A82822B|nr:uncharacterized protein LOC133206379 [Saccostrea echinata]
MTKWLFLVVTCLLFGDAASVEIHQVYDFEIDSEGHAMEGYLFPDLHSGDKVQVNLAEGDSLTENAKDVKYIRLKIQKSKNNTRPPPFRVFDSEYFSVDKDNYIVVDTNNTAELQEKKELRFYVVLINEHGQAVSNPLPFIVRIENKTEDSSDYPMHSAIFAGVLVLIIVLLALGIPFVVRAKRRFKQGKPVMKLGSHPGSSPDLKAIMVSESVEDIPGMKRQQSEPNWFGENRILSYEDEVKTEKATFTKEIKQLERKISQGQSNSAALDDDDGLVKYTKTPQKGILKNSDSNHNDNEKVSVSADVHGKPYSEEQSKL